MEAQQPKEQPKAAAEAAVEETLKQAQERLGPRLEQMQAELANVNEKVRSFIKKNPGTSLLGAAALGFVIGRLASRR